MDRPVWVVISLCIVGFVVVSGCSVKIPAAAVTPQTPVVAAEVPVIDRSNLTVTFIDVGQGDAIWIVSPYNTTMLIDAGESDTVAKVIDVIEPVAYINFVVATHPHSDHIGGMTTILDTYRIGQFVDSGYPHTTSVYENLLTVIENKPVLYTNVKNGDTIRFSPEIDVKVLNPQDEFFDEINDNSVVLLMTYRDVSFLFAGDAGEAAEKVYVRSLRDVTVLKVPHHGSDTGTSDYLLSRISPKISVISVGPNNQYSHPDDLTIVHLKTTMSKIYRTDIDGTITITTDGNDYTVITTPSV